MGYDCGAYGLFGVVLFVNLHAGLMLWLYFAFVCCCLWWLWCFRFLNSVDLVVSYVI